MAKIKEEQLKEVTEQQQKLTTVLSQMGVLEIQKLNLAQEVKKNMGGFHTELMYQNSFEHELKLNLDIKLIPKYVCK